MSENNATSGNAIQHYKEVCRGMRTNLLITVNNSGGANALGSEELRVVSRTDDGKVLLSGRGKTYQIRHDTPDGTVLEEISDGGTRGEQTYIETIEVIGIDA